jgi:DNA-binding phage protein
LKNNQVLFGFLGKFRQIKMQEFLKRPRAKQISYKPSTGLSSKTGLGRQTLYDLINDEKEFNPTLSTLAAILKAIAA